jgi:hypothetical protein
MTKVSETIPTPHHQILIVGMEVIPETVIFKHLICLIDLEDFIYFSHYENSIS